MRLCLARANAKVTHCICYLRLNSCVPCFWSFVFYQNASSAAGTTLLSKCVFSRGNMCSLKNRHLWRPLKFNPMLWNLEGSTDWLKFYYKMLSGTNSCKHSRAQRTTITKQTSITKHEFPVSITQHEFPVKEINKVLCLSGLTRVDRTSCRLTTSVASIA